MWHPREEKGREKGERERERKRKKERGKREEPERRHPRRPATKGKRLSYTLMDRTWKKVGERGRVNRPTGYPLDGKF